MNVRKTISLLLLFLLLIGCTPATEAEPMAQLDGEKQTTPEVAATKPAELETESEESDESALLRPTEEVGGETTTGETVHPAEVDLAKVTAEPSAEGDEAMIQPGPGEPNLAQAMAHRAATVLAEELGIEAEDIEVVSIDAVQWRDSSLGCPRAGQSYLTVITPGFRVILEADGERYEYHTDQNRTAIRCEGRASGGGPEFPEK